MRDSHEAIRCRGAAAALAAAFLLSACGTVQPAPPPPPPALQPSGPALAWIQQIAMGIHANWAVPPGTPKGLRCKLRVVLTPQGAIDSAEIAGSSGNQTFDASVLRAVYRAQPFPVPADSALMQPILFTFAPNS